jgi:chromosome partitioning protein
LLAGDAYTTEVENIDLVYPRSLIIDEDYQLQVNTDDGAYYLTQDLSVISTLPYDYVLIDCPPSLGKITVDTLLVSNFLIIPTQADFYSTYSIKDMMGLIGKVRQVGNPGLLYRVLITRFDKRNRVHNNIKTQLGYTFGSGLFETIIHGDAELLKTALFGFPTNSSRGVKQHRKLVDELLEYIQKTQLS